MPAIKLGICVFLAACFWFRSQIGADIVFAKCGENVLSVENSPQGLKFRIEVWDQVVLPGSRPRSNFGYSLRPTDRTLVSASLGSALQGVTIEQKENPDFFSSGSYFYRGYLLTVPHFLLAVIAISLIHLIVKVVSRKRRVAGLCQQCGYDIRANSDRCSECGALICAGGTPRDTANAKRRIITGPLSLQLAFGVLVLHAATALVKTFFPHMGPTCLALSNAITSLAPPPPAFILVNEGWLNAAFLAVYAGCMLATCLLWGVILAWLIDIAAYAMACLRPYKDEDNGHLRSLRGA